MRTTKKVISGVLAVCLLASTSVVSSFAAVQDDSAAVSGADVAQDSKYTRAAEAMDNEFAYNGNDLGATYSKESTTFKVWSPNATEVSLNIYAKGSAPESKAAGVEDLMQEQPLTYDDQTGVWSTTVEGDLKDLYYTYDVTAVPLGGTLALTNETQDVYSVATGVNGKRSMICDLSSTNPEGWENDSHVLLDRSTQSSVWELHVKDFSYDEASGVSEANRGKYLAFTENGTTLNNEGQISTCIDYLKELGITTVQLNPSYDFETVNEAGSNSQFNWGYDPQNYNVPEGSYSSNPYDGNVRINEFKQMVQALHEAGISVVMDVVYNHTNSTSSCFQKTVPNYYYRMKSSGAFSDGSGCGNECATERAMYRNYVIQSCLYWVNEYHVDGFRYDLMGIMDVETMNAVRDALDQVDTRITMWGEGWSGSDSYHPTNTCSGTKYYPATQANASKLSDRIALFNDAIRDGVKGSAMGITNQGFIQGASTSAMDIRYGVRANSAARNRWLAVAPSQCVTYAACHDNATLYDQIIGAAALGDYGDRVADAVKMNKLAGAIIYGSQGISFTLAGEEMGRSKDGDTNSYKSPATLNMIKWQNVVDYADLVSYYKGVMQIKSHFTPLTAMDKSYQDAFIFTNAMKSYTNQVSYTIANDQENEWQKMAFLYNSAKEPATITLKDTSVTDWVIIANNEAAGLDKLDEVTGSTFTVPALSAVIAVDKASYESVGLQSNMGKVKVNYVYNKNGEKLDDSVILQGTVGTGYQTSPSVGIPSVYLVEGVEGDTTGTFGEGTKEVTYYYKDFVPESIDNADFNGDGRVNIMDVTEMQKYLVGDATFTDAQVAAFDLNYDDANSISDITMLQKHITGFAVSSGTVVVNHYYLDSKGEQQKLTPSEVIKGRVGDDYTTNSFKVVGYGVDPDASPEKPNGKIPYGSTLEINYNYIASSLDINLHVKHSGTLTWAPSLWVWGADLTGKDSANYTTSGEWPGDTLTDEDGDGWFDMSFTYQGAGSYNVIVSNNKLTQTIDYKGFVDNDMWIVIDDSKLASGEYLTFYTDNPDTNPDAPIASQISFK